LVWGTYATEIIQFRVPFDCTPPLLYLATGICTVIAGYACHRLLSNKKTPNRSLTTHEQIFIQSVSRYKKVIDIASVASCVGAVCMAADMIFVNGATLADFAQFADSGEVEQHSGGKSNTIPG
jgi:hypothetical protein